MATKGKTGSVVAAPSEEPRDLAQPGEAAARLGEMVQQVLEQALEVNLRSGLDRLASDFEQRLADSIEKTLTSSIARLEIRGVDLQAKHEEAMDKKIRELIEDATAKLEFEQQQAVVKFSDAMRVRLMQMTAAEEDRLKKETGEVLRKAVADVQETMLIELAKFTEQTRNRGEEMAAESLKELKAAEHKLSEQLKSMEEIGSRIAQQLQSRSEKVMDEATTKLRTQMEEATGKVHQSFMRHIVTELNSKQTTFVEEAMKPLNEAAEQNLKRARKELTRMVREMGQRFVGGMAGPEEEE